MPRYVSRILSSFASLVLLLVMVFFLSRLTGDPAALFLPIDASPEMIDNFRELHGLNDPLIVQFGRYVWDVAAPRLRREPAPGAAGDRGGAPGLRLDAVAGADHHGAGRRRGDRHRVAGGVPARRGLRPDRHLHLADRRLGARLLDRHRRHHRVRHRPRLAADERNRHGLALDPADRRPVHPAVRADPAGGARLDGAGLRLGLCQDRAGQGRRRPLDHLRAHAQERHAAGDHRDRRPGGGAA